MTSYFKQLICFIFTIVLSIVIYSCSKDKKETPQPESPKPTTTLTYQGLPHPDYSLSTINGVAIPNKGFYIYENDTVRFAIKITSVNSVDSIKIFKVNNISKVETLLPEFTQTSFSDPKNITDTIFYAVGNTSSFEPFHLKVVTVEQKTAKNTFSLMRFDSLKTSEQKDLYLYGTTGTVNGDFRYKYPYYNIDANFKLIGDVDPNYGGVICALSFNYRYGNLNYKNNIEGIITNSFDWDVTVVPTIARNSFFIKDNSINYQQVSSYKSCKESYQKVKEYQVEFIKNLQPGDQILFFANRSRGIFFPKTYGVLKIKEVYDDGSDVLDNDYIKFDAKVFSSYSFK